MDDYDMVDEKQDVAIITPADSPDEPDPDPAANECECWNGLLWVLVFWLTESVVEAMRARFMPAAPDLEIEAEGYDTWKIESYRQLAKREHGPKFTVGGQPWYGNFRPGIGTGTLIF